MEDLSPFRLLFGYAILFGLPLSVIVFPRSSWARVLYTQVGPSLDHRSMTRSACVRAAGAFAILGAASLSASFGTFAFADLVFGPLGHPLPIEALFFTYFLMGALGIAASIYLLIRAPFRPAALPTAEPPLRGQFLKQYLSRDGHTAASSFALEDGLYAVVPGSDTRPAAGSPSAEVCSTLEDAERAALLATGYLRPARRAGPAAPH